MHVPCYLGDVPKLPPSLRDAPSDSQLLVLLNRLDQPVLRLAEDRDLLREVCGDERRANATIRRLVRRRSLVPVRRGAWAVRSERGALMAGALELVGWLTPGEHLVSGGAALARHQLTDQAFRSIVVATDQQHSDWSWQGQTITYRRVSRDRLWGAFRSHAPVQGSRTRVARADKAILDCLVHQDWGVSVPQVAYALDSYLARDRERALGHLEGSARRYDIQALTRRLGYLIELVTGEKNERLRDLVTLPATRIPLALRSPQAGEVDRRWDLLVNVSAEALLEHRVIG